MTTASGINPEIPPSGPGCAQCDATGGWWVHLRRCAQCGFVGCCDSSPSRHATLHWRETRHHVFQSFEPDERWFWDYDKNVGVLGPRLADPQHHPEDQPVPGPEGRVPDNWRDLVR